jgi:outer membrane immunogenic protein
MKKLLLGGLVLGAIAAPLAANAADLARPAVPVYKAPPPFPVTTWTGFYLGGYGGGGLGFSRVDYPTFGTSTGDFSTSGGMAGGTAGFNWQAGAFVFGVEGDGGWAGFSGSSACPFPAGAFTCTARDSWLSSLRGRVGWAVGPSLLLYGTGGAAFGDVQYATNIPGFPGATSDRTGWTAGAGLEWMFAPNWSAKLEYMHYDLGTLGCSAVTCGTTTFERFAVDTGKVGINYHFNWGPGYGPY